jgi:hypothetical protein
MGWHGKLINAIVRTARERRDSDRRKNAAEASQASVEHRKLHLRSRDCDDKPTPAFFRVVELGGQVDGRPSV